MFEEAKNASEELFNEDQMTIDDAAASEEVPTENVDSTAEETTDNTDNQPVEQNVLNDATHTAEVAAQTAAAKDAELQQIRQELEATRQANVQLQGTIDELSKQNQQNLVEEALAPPVLDVNALAFADEDTVRAAQEKYANDMAAYNREMFMKEFAPVIEQANEAKYAKEKNEMISALSQIPELSGIENMVPQIEKIIRNNKALSSDVIPMEEKFITAYAIAKGVNSINTPPPVAKEPTTEELMDMYNNNPAFQEMVEKQRLEQIKQSQQVPPFSASSGAVNAALNIKEKPKTFEEASALTRKLFGAG